MIGIENYRRVMIYYWKNCELIEMMYWKVWNGYKLNLLLIDGGRVNVEVVLIKIVNMYFWGEEYW